MTTKKIPILKCGCVANGFKVLSIDEKTKTVTTSRPECTIHNQSEPMDPQPDIDTQKAFCIYCGKSTKANTNLPFFKYKVLTPNTFDCGCKGY